VTRPERKTVLVIDDDRDFRELMKWVVEGMDLAFLSAPNCAEGIEVLGRERDRLALVLLDYFMPGMEPEKCADAIKREAAVAAVPVVLCTAALDCAVRASELGISRWLGKPFNLEDFERVFRECTTRAAA
jgi:CheY-like chemotaxis protein